MGSYYFLVSQLPYLIYGQPPPMSSEAFKNLAKPMLDSRDAKILDLVGTDLEPGKPDSFFAEITPSCGSAFIDNWRKWDRALRLNLAKYRAVKMKREKPLPADPPMLPTDAASTAAKAIAVAESPLEGEILLDKARWSAIEEFQGIDIFDSNVIFAYLLKLKLLERRAVFQTETGFVEYKSLYTSIVGSISPAGETK